MKTILKNTFFIILGSVIFSSCATILASKKASVNVASNVEGTEVFVNGFRQGVTPLQVSLEKGKDHTIEFRKDGYLSTSRVVGQKMAAGWLILDILFGFWPIIIDAATGDWKTVDTDVVMVNLEEKKD